MLKNFGLVAVGVILAVIIKKAWPTGAAYIGLA